MSDLLSLQMITLLEIDETNGSFSPNKWCTTLYLMVYTKLM